MSVNFRSFLLCVNPFILIEPMYSSSSSLFFFHFDSSNYTQNSFQFFLFFSFTSSGSFSGCPLYSLSLQIKRHDHIESLLLCPTNSFFSKFPSQKPQVNSSTFYHEHVNSIFPSALTPFKPYEIQFEVQNFSHIQLFLSFNSFSSYFNVTLNYLDMSYNVSSVFTSSFEKNEQVDVSSYLERFLIPGNYSLTIENHEMDFNSLKFDLTRSYCVAYDYSLFIFSYSSEQPFVASVSPPSGYDLSPAQDLTIVLYFSTLIYSRESVLIDYQFTDYMFNIVQLQLVANDTQDFISATSITASLDNMRWSFVFPGSKLTPGNSYLLILQPQQLYDANGNDFNLPFHNIYSIVSSTCGNHGNLDPNYNCKCDEGYAGIVSCSSCDIGYKNIATQGDLQCVADNFTKCEQNTCGCTYTTENPEVCIPLGNCSVSQGIAVCSCLSTYTGKNCEKCSNTEYQQNYPFCQPQSVCSPACQNGGVCENSVCKCLGNWALPSCSSCKPNYYGDDCLFYKDNNGAFKMMLVGIVLIGFTFLFGISYFLYRHFQKRRRSNFSINYEEETDRFFGSDFEENKEENKELSSINLENLSKALEEDEENQNN